MTVPKSKVLSVSKGIMALTNLTHGSPEVKQNVIVKNYVTPVVKEEKKTRNAVIDGVEDPNVVIVEPTTNKEERVSYENPYESLPNERDLTTIEDIRNTYKQLNETIKEKENIAKALTIMLNLIENNPLIINKLIIAPADVLTELIKLLTSSDEVKFNYLFDADVGCTCGVNKYVAIDKIYVIKNGETKIMKYDYPDAIQLLDQHRISYKFVVNEI
mgnify:CR=1 FL=1